MASDVLFCSVMSRHSPVQPTPDRSKQTLPFLGLAAVPLKTQLYATFKNQRHISTLIGLPSFLLHCNNEWSLQETKS